MWDLPTYGESHELQANRIYAKIVNHKSKEVVVLEMWCPWIEKVWSITIGVTRTIPWIYSPVVQYYHGRAWRLVKDYGRTIKEVAGKKGQKICYEICRSL